MICVGEGGSYKKILPLKEISSAHRRPSRGAGGVVTPEQKLGGRTPHILVPKTISRDVYDNTCDNGDFRLQSTHFLRPQTTQELPKKHHEAVPPE